ncbi:MAG: homoserine kinase [Planctomycetota bacterium]|jgi:homoserine kinase
MPPLDSSRHLTVRVAASTSNLGPGFDCLGLALDLFSEVRVRGPIEGAVHTRRVHDSAASAWPDIESDLTIRAFERACEVFGVPAQKYHFEIASEIPIARGLGSSGAAVAAGIRLASFLADTTPTLEAEISLGIEIEGHPDNVTASLAGGATLCVPIPNEAPAWTPVECSDALGFALAWPQEPLSTQAARRVLPAQIEFADALENPRRLGLLLAGLKKADARLLSLGGEDRLHEQYRLPLIPGAAEALTAARDRGAWLASLSGSGSALFAIGPIDSMNDISEAMRTTLEGARTGATARTARIVLEGATVREESS